LQTKGFYRALLLAGCAGTFFIAATPAMAQEADDEEEASDSQIVVTGSRIQRSDYVSNSPTVTVDETFLRESSTAAIEQQLNKLPQFVVSQSSTVKNNDPTGLLPAGGDIQPNATNTPGAATVSLRGVGANRSLVLIDGRRGTPGNATGTVDVSTIPNAALERVEIVSGGASATYGADAVAGVTNFILKKDFQGIELDAQIGFDQRGNGFEYQFGGIMGTDFPDGRGNISLAMSINTRERMLQKDNPWYQELWANPNTTSGTFFFVPRPGIGVQLPANGVCETTPSGCVVTDAFPGANPAVPNNTANVYVNPDGSLFTGVAGFFATGFNERGGVDFFQPWPERDNEIGVDWNMTSLGTLKAINALTPQTVPTTRYNFLARGNYEINDWIGVFGQGMFSNSNTYTVQEPGPITFGWDLLIPWGEGRYTGGVSTFFGSYQNPAVPSSVLPDGTTNPQFINGIPGTTFHGYNGILPCATPGSPGYNNDGCSNTEAFQAVVPQSIQDILNGSGATSVTLAGFLPLPRATYSDVTTYTMIAGLEGSIPGTDWTWEAFVNHGISRTLSRQTGMYSLERLRAVFTAPNFGQNFSYRGNSFGGGGGLSAGFGATTGTCTTGLNFFQGYQGVSQDCFEAITADVSNRLTTRQTIAETNLQGGLFDLPAGQVRFALGASYRENRFEFTNETLSTGGRSFLDQTVGIYPSQNMEEQGFDVRELYGELLIPVLSDIPFIQELNLEVGGRMSDYSTTGTSYTFKVLGDWAVNDWLRFRGGFNRAERAPNIAELQLTPQQSFATDPIGDVCSTRNSSTSSANPDANGTSSLDVQAMCLALMQRDNGGVYVDVSDPNGFYAPGQELTRQPAGTGGGAAFPVAVGNQYYRDHINSTIDPLHPEVADTWTVGAVIQSPASSGPLSRLNLTVDYFNIKIKDPIGNSGGGGVLLHCVSPDFNAAAAGVADGASSAADLNDPEIRARALAAIAEATCPQVFRNPSTGGFGATGGFDGARVITTYDNDGVIKLSGIDATVSWSTDVGPGSLFLSLNGNYMLNFSVQPFTGSPLLDYVGTQGTGLKGVNFGSSFEYRIFGTLGYSWGPANVSLQWQHTPKTDDSGDVNFHNGLAPEKNNIAGLPAYNLFSLNGGYELNEHLRLRFGVDNLFNKKPPITGYVIDPAEGQLPGGSYSLFHDVQGRRFSLGANVRF
jgi:outer membrane receptor protein involved in Fe transport